MAKQPKAAEYRLMTEEQLGMTLKDIERDLFKLRFQSATDRLETPSEMLKAKRAIARIKTVQRQREIAAAPVAPPAAAADITTQEKKA
jgi:large subunit ribosomal protein L29